MITPWDFAKWDMLINVVGGLVSNLLFGVLVVIVTGIILRYRSWRQIRGGRQTVSPDGKHTAYEANGEIYVSDRAGVRNITHSIAVDYEPLWAPNNRWFAFQSDRNGGDFNIWVADSVSGKMVPVTSGLGRERVVEWGEDCSLTVDLGGSRLTIKQAEIEKKLR